MQKRKPFKKHLFVYWLIMQAFCSTFATLWNVKKFDSIELNDENIIYGLTNNFPLRIGFTLFLIIAQY